MEQFKICRCCLEKIITESDNTGDSKRKAYEKMLEDVFNILFSNNYMDVYFCDKCIKRILDASTFKEMVMNNDTAFLNYHKNQDEEESYISHVKTEENKQVIGLMEFNTTDNSSDGDETLAHLKCETNITTSESDKQNSPEAFLSSEKTRKRKRECVIEQDKINITKVMEHRGKGPILRENSLKLLANSTAAVFQWNKSRYRCFCCKEPFSNINLLKTHTNCHTLNEIERKIINQQNRLVKVDISSLNCKLCNKELKDLDVLKEHLADHNINVDDHLLVPFKIESKLKCQICSEPFMLFRLLNIHMNKHYQKHVCYVCGAGFSNLVFLNLHRTRSHRPIHCLKCDLSFEHRTQKKQHDTEIHGIKVERKNRFPCPFCSERFFQENLRVIHLVEKHGMKKPELNCQFCSKSFITKSLLNNHVKTVHMKEKNHECGVCHNLFYTKSDVARHKVTHTGEKNFVCTLCNNPFASKDSLRRHMKRSHAQ